MNYLFATTLALSAAFTTGSNLRATNERELQNVFPLYNQQCRDDAGPPFLDDSETFGNRKYHNGKPAFAVGDCPDPLKGACATKPKTEAFLEGPIDCGGKGWFCRILEEPDWPNIMLNTDVNFGYCNTTEGFNDAGFDRSGHCHGSDSDETFYWWVRDHWHRQYVRPSLFSSLCHYRTTFFVCLFLSMNSHFFSHLLLSIERQNGRLRCCCGWDDVNLGTIVNRCDHRRLVTQEENLENCRDANEEGVSPYNGGCDPNNSPTLNFPIPEDDSKCWEVQKFGEPSDGNDNEGEGEGEGEDGINPPSDEDEGNDEDENMPDDNQEEGNEDEEYGIGDEDEEENSPDVSQEEENEEEDEEEEENSPDVSQEEENEEEDEEEEENLPDVSQEEENEEEDDEEENLPDVSQEEENEEEDDEEENLTDVSQEEENEEEEEEEEENLPGGSQEDENEEEENLPDESQEEENEDEEDEDNCEDDESFLFKGRRNKTCRWIGGKANRKERLCSKSSVSASCPETCGICAEDVNVR